MKEKTLILAKASPVVSKKYESLVCVGGITEKEEWRRIYPVPWACFWKGKDTCFKKKSWIEYELKNNLPSDHRKESRKIIFESIHPLKEESYKQIREILQKKLTTIEELEKKSHKEVSMGVIKPELIDFIEEDANNEKFKKRKSQKTLDMTDAVKIDIAEKKYSYRFKCGHPNCRGHKMMCEDWELGELYRHCEDYRKKGKYKDSKEVFDKIKKRMFFEMLNKKELYFIVGTHFIHPTYMIIGVVYPKKTDKWQILN